MVYLNVMQLRRAELERHLKAQEEILQLIHKELSEFLANKGYLLCNHEGELSTGQYISGLNSLYFLKSTIPDQPSESHRHPFVGGFRNLNLDRWTLEIYGCAYHSEMISLAHEVNVKFHVWIVDSLGHPECRFQKFTNDPSRNIQEEDDEDDDR